MIIESILPRRCAEGFHHVQRSTMAHQRFFTVLRVAACCVGPMVLTACGSGPSESDIERVVKASVAADRAGVERLTGSSGAGFFPTVHAVKKLGCTEASSSVYTCDVELDVTPAGGSRTKSPTTLRFAKGSDGWAAMR